MFITDAAGTRMIPTSLLMATRIVESAHAASLFAYARFGSLMGLYVGESVSAVSPA